MSAVERRERMAQVVAQALDRQMGFDLRDGKPTAPDYEVADAVLALLAEPTDQGETRTEWGVRRNHGDVGSVAGPYSQRQTEVMAKAWDGTVVSREVTTGPWVEAPDRSP